jgi:hypothetical protein
LVERITIKPKGIKKVSNTDQKNPKAPVGGLFLNSTETCNPLILQSKSVVIVESSVSFIYIYILIQKPAP